MSRIEALHVVILAAGRGKRMQTHLPKVLHTLAGQPMLRHVIQAAKNLNAAQIHVIIGHEAEQIRTQITDGDIHWIYQAQQLGTGHAVLQALPHIPSEAKVLILSGDVPLTQLATLQQLVHSTETGLALLLANLPSPFGFGRIIRNAQHQIQAIIEEKDASVEQKQIQEIYTGICCADAHRLKNWLPKLSTQNAQGEYYLTDIIGMAVADHIQIESLKPQYLFEIQGVNTLAQLHQLERTWQQHLAMQLLDAGVHVLDTQRIDIRGTLNCASDVQIDVNVIFEGHCSIDKNTRIGAHSVIKNATIGKNCLIHPHSILQDCVIADHCEVGPFARLRPGTQLASRCKVGNFVETKNAQFDEGSKASHLSYIGDAEIGKQVNIGAGTITCNYDGVNKHKTIIEDHAFIGSDTQLVAPVTVGAHATIGAGSTIRDDAPGHALTLTPNRQKSILGWRRKEKNTL